MTLLLSFSAYSQVQQPQDSTKTGVDLGTIKLPNPNSIVSKYTYDPVLDRYFYNEKVGSFDVKYPLILTPVQYQNLVLKEQMALYYKQKIDAAEGKKNGSKDDQKNLIPDFYVNSGLFETIFGGNTISIIPQGSAEVDLGILFSKQDNPIISPQNRSNLTFDFDQRISLSLVGNVGTRLRVTANYDTEATFGFQNLIKLEYDPLAAAAEEVSNRTGVDAGGLVQKGEDFLNSDTKSASGNDDSILKKIEVGNVNMPINSSLITGAQSLFGVKTQLQFGRTTVTAVFSEQQSDRRSVVAQGGGTLEEFQFFARDYDENRHYFLAQYFRDNYEKALLQYPFINSTVQITRVEVWVTNRNNQTQNVRNIVALQDLGESKPEQIALSFDESGAQIPLPAGFINLPDAPPDNQNNDFNPETIGTTSLLEPAIRDITTVNDSGFDSSITVSEGFDYGKLESAQKLIEGSDYILEPQLGYISLNQRLLNDEVLAVAFQYTINGQVYQVGEFANDGVDATAGNTDTNNNGIPDSIDASIGGTDTDGDGIIDSADADVDGNGTIDNGPDVDGDGINDGFIPPSQGSSQALVTKMLKSAVTVVQDPIWDLMMKNVYDTGAFDLSQEDFRLNIFYTEASPLNYISPAVDGAGNPVEFASPYNNNTPNNNDDILIEETPLIRLFHLDRLNLNNDPQVDGDGFFDFVPNITVIPRTGKIIFTKVEPFGQYLFDVLDDPNAPGDYDAETYNNLNQEKYVYDKLYKTTKTQALEESEKDKFQIKGRYKGNAGGGGIPIGAFNVPRGSVTVSANGQILVEGVDYTVDYTLGRVNILNESLLASNTPIDISVENNAVFGQQTKRFMGVDVQHQFNDNFVIGGTFLNLRERPITQKANFDSEPINNTIFGFNGNYSTEVPALTRAVNKLPNVDTDVPSTLSVRGEFAYLLPGSPKGTDFQGEATSYIDDFEGTQGAISLLGAQSWFLSSRPVGLPNNIPGNDNNGIQSGYGRALLNWYTIDPIFFSSQRPDGVTNDDISTLESRRVFINELFPSQDIVQGQNAVLNTLDLIYYPDERGPYNFDPTTSGGTPLNPNNSWAGITREITSTDFEQANVEYIEFWVQDPFLDDPANTGGKLTINLGNISEDILKDGKKQFENGLPQDGDISDLNPTSFESVVPNNQSLIYTFDTTGQERTNQDVGYDGYDDLEEANIYNVGGLDFGEDPSKDNYSFYLANTGNIQERYRQYNGLQGNTPDTFTDTDRGSTTQPDVEDINRDNTMNTINAYYEYEIDITPAILSQGTNSQYIYDTREGFTVDLPNGQQRSDIKWYQFRVPITEFTNTVGGITDIRSVRFARMYMTGFNKRTVLRFGSLDLVRSDWRRFTQDLDNNPNNNSANADFAVGIVGEIENGGTNGGYVVPPGVFREELQNQNNVIRQNEQSLVLETCELEPSDSRGVFKNINLDMRQYKRVRMFMHAEPIEPNMLDDGELIGFVRFGNDFSDNFYQIEVPLRVSQNSSSPEEVWPQENEINIPLEFFQRIKAEGISNNTLINQDPTFYNVIDGQLDTNALANGDVPFDPIDQNPGLSQQRIAIKGNPNFGQIRVLMVGLKSASNNATNACGEVWFNELRMSDLDNEGGWAAVLSMDSQIADFANISATARRSTIGFGGIEQNPNERSREDIKQYDFVTNMNLGQILPKKWGINLPFSYAQSETLITPEFDGLYQDLTLENRIDAANNDEEVEIVKQQSEDYTKRKSISFIGVKKNRTGDKEPKFYDIENFTFNYAYNKEERRNFEIEQSLNQDVRVGANYNYNFKPLKIEPFKKNDSILKSRYWKILKDFNLNLLPSNVTINSNINRQFNSQRFREVDLTGNNLAIPELFRRNYLFDFSYGFNYNLTESLSFNFLASNQNIVRNYFVDNDIVIGRQDPTLNIWNGFFDPGDPNIQNQQIQLNYELPFRKIPFLKFLTSTYTYSGDFQWQKSPDFYQNFQYEDANGNTQFANLGNTIQNSNTHTLNTSINMNELYKILGLKVNQRNRRGSNRNRNSNNDSEQKNKTGAGKKTLNSFLNVLTMIKRVQVNYSENNGTFLPGYTRTPGFLGTMKPTFGYTLGSQRDIRDLAGRNGWLTVFPDFNQQFTQNKATTLDYTANLEPMRDLKIDVVGRRTFLSNSAQNFTGLDNNNDGISDGYDAQLTNSFGSFEISTILFGTAFSKSDEINSETFDAFRENRLIIARRLATNAGINVNDPANLDGEGYPLGFGKNSQRVLLPAFLAAYKGQDAEGITTRASRDVPLPNWTLKYTGLMKIKWFKDNFRRFSITHGYRSSYSINQFRNNLDYVAPDFAVPATDPVNANAVDQAGNFKAEILYSNINLQEQFTPLVRIDMEMKNSIKILAEIRRDRLLSLSLDNNLLTENLGSEYTLGLGYRIKDLAIRTGLAGPSKIAKSDLNMRADISVRDDKTIIRYLDIDNSQITTGQIIWGAKFTADYAFSKNITAIFYFDYTFSDFAISTSFPQTAIRSGLTLRYNFGN